MRLPKWAAAALGAASLFLLVACATVGQSDVSRAHLYGSLKALSADSRAIVVGSVTGQTSAKDIDGKMEFTLNTFHVNSALKSDGHAVPGATVIVRQTGGPDTGATPPTPLFTVGTTYLLFLTPSGLKAPLDTQYYVTGLNAGAYQENPAAGTGSFRQPDHSKADKIPVTLTLADVMASLQ